MDFEKVKKVAIWPFWGVRGYRAKYMRGKKRFIEDIEKYVFYDYDMKKIDDVPIKTNLLQCDTNIIISQLQFIGGGAVILNSARSLILSKVTTLVDGPNGALCQTLQNLTITKVTPLLHNISKFIHKYIPIHNKSMNSWQDVEKYALSTLD